MKDMEVLHQPIVLIVDDSPEDRHTCRTFLDTGYRVLEADTGQAGLELIGRLKPDCILLDYRLPDLDGLEFLETLLENPSCEQPAVVVLTGHADVTLAVTALQAGASDFIEKDHITAVSIKQVVARAISNVRLSCDLDRQRQWLDATFANVAEGVVAVDASARVTLCNQAFAELSGWSLAEAMGQPINEVLALTQDGSAHDWRQTLRQILSGERQVATPRWSGQLIARNGSRRSIAFKLAPILAQRNSDTGVVITLTDLSEIHESRRALADSEQQLRLALEASGMGCFDWDLETGSVTWNRQHEALWGFQPGETTGAYADFSRRVHPDDLPEVEAALARSRDDRVPYCREFRVVWPDGSTHWMGGRGEFVYQEDGRALRMRGTVVEVTQRKQTDAALQTTRELLARIIESAPSAVFAMDRAHRFTLTNQANLSACRLQWDQLIGRTEREVFPPVTAARLWADNEQVMHTGQALQLEEELVLADGSRIDVITTKFPLRDSQGEIVGLGGVATDISERKRAQQALGAAEERFRLAMDATRDGIWDWDVPTGNTYYSPAYFGMLGYAPGDFPESFETWTGLLHPDERESVTAEAMHLLATVGEYQLEFRMRSRAGPYIWVASRAKVVARDAAGNLLRVIGTHSEITERKVAEQALRISEEGLRLALDAVQMGTFDWDLVTAHITLSPRHEALSGFSPGEFDGTYAAATQRVDRDDLLAVESELARCRAARERFSLEYRVNWPDGSTHWVSSLGEFEYASDGKPLRLRGVTMDVSDRKARETALLDAEAWRLASRYTRSLIETSLDPMVTISADGVITDVNRATEDATGWSRTHLIGSDFADYFTDPAQARAIYRQAFVEGRVRDHPLTLRHTSGQLTDVLYNASVVRDEDGGIQGVFAAARDITARLQAEQALEASQASLRRAQSVGQIGSWRLFRDSEVFDISEETAKLFDLPGDRPVTFTEWFARVHPDDQAGVAAAWQDALRGAPYERVYRIVVRGEVVWIRALAELDFDERGTLLNGVGTVQDITPLKRAELEVRRAAQRLQLATEAADIGIWTWSFADDRLNWDDRLLAWYEVPDGMRETGPDYAFWRSRVHPDDIERIEASFAAARLAQSVWSGEFRILLPGGRVRYIESAALFEYHPDGAAVRMVGINRDVTAQRALEENLREARTAADAANEAKGAFLANVSHEIRTPMNAILGFAQLLEKDALTPEQRGMVRRIRTASESLMGLLNDILDFSKIESGRFALERQPFSLDGVSSNVIGLLRSMAVGKGLELRFDMPANCDITLLGDAGRLEQVLVNLTSNAIKFTDQGSVEVRVIAKEVTGTQARLRFEVRDTGIGISQEQQDALFTRFTQADGSITRRYGGTGLGLSISKHLIEAMGGTLGFDSTLGVGSTFWFEASFPLAPADALLETAVASAPLTVTGPRLKGLQCLVVDDSAMNRDLLQYLLQREGAHVDVAADGRAALEYLRARSQPVDAVLIDLQMPVMDGLELIGAIRGELGLSGLPLIAVSAAAGRKQRQAAENAGANDFLLKPVDLEAFVTTLLRWTQSAALVAPTPAMPR
ncbi:PAS domain-containing protein [Methylolobus aquaticus]